MTALLVAVSLLLALLLILVAGLLRSHAEILRRLHDLESGESLEPADDLVSETAAPGRTSESPAPSIDGSSLAGDAVRVGFAPGGESLLAFLTSGCSVCGSLWSDLGPATTQALDGVRIVVVAKDAKLESVSKLRRLTPEGTAVVLSSAAWDEYAVPASPYFVHVGKNGEIAGEGVSSSWEGVRSLLADARADLGEVSGQDGAARMRRAESELVGAGLDPDDPSLYGRVARET